MKTANKPKKKRDRSSEYTPSTAFKLPAELFIDGLDRRVWHRRYEPYPDESFARVMGKVWRTMPLDYLLEIIKTHRPDTCLTIDSLRQIVGEEYRVSCFDDGQRDNADLTTKRFLSRKRSKEACINKYGRVGVVSKKSTNETMWYAVCAVPDQGYPIKIRCKSCEHAENEHDRLEIEHIPAQYRVLNHPRSAQAERARENDRIQRQHRAV